MNNMKFYTTCNHVLVKMVTIKKSNFSESVLYSCLAQ